MSDFLRLLVLFLAAANAPAAARAFAGTAAAGDRRRRIAAVGQAVCVAAALGLAGALLANRILDGLEVAPESFRTGAGVVMLAVGVPVILFGRASGAIGPDEGSEGRLSPGVFPLGLPWMANPAWLVAAISASVDDGRGKTLAAVAVSLGVSGAVLLGRWRGANPLLDGVARVLGALLVVFAVAFIVDGVRAI